MAKQGFMDQSISSSLPATSSSHERVSSSSSTTFSSPKSPPPIPPSPSSSITNSQKLSTEKNTVNLAITTSDSLRNRNVNVFSSENKSDRGRALKVKNVVNNSVSGSTTSFITKELEKFDPTLPEEEFSPQLQLQEGKPSTLKSEDSNSVLYQIGQYMELNAVHPVIKSFMVGSISGTCSTVLFQPLDLLKTRLQTPPIRHGAPATAALRATSVAAAAAASPTGLFSILGHIVRDEKLLGLWKGMTPSLTRCVPGVGLYFASIHGLKIAFDIHGDPTAVQSVLLGVTGRSISGVMMIPFTVIKTRFESTVYNYGSIREALYSIYSKEGVRGLTCGLLPTLLRDAPFSGLYLLMYTSTKKSVPQEWIESTTFGPYVRFSCGVVAGIGASLVTQPADVLKTKMQLYPDKFKSIPEVAAYVYKKYGAQGYFKGLLPRMVRRTLIAAMSWTVYEQVMKSMGLK